MTVPAPGTQESSWAPSSPAAPSSSSAPSSRSASSSWSASSSSSAPSPPVERATSATPSSPVGSSSGPAGRCIDLRSDTVTLPSAEMLATVLDAPLGDDVLGEDPSVRALEEEAAALLGKEAALLCTSGTAANQIAVMCLTRRGQEVVLGAESHLYALEVAGLATLSQVQARPVTGRGGVPLAEDYEQALQAPDVTRLQVADTGLFALENSYDLNAGRAVTPAQTAEIAEVARGAGIPVYLDGARLFNAAAALEVTPADLCRDVDAVQFCLTKGLGAPVGAVLAGTRELVAEARKARQRLGGGMRQAGIIAAPGRYALAHHLDRIGEDNARARLLADRIGDIEGLTIEPVETNIVLVRLAGDAARLRDELLTRLDERGVKAKPIGADAFRMVLHLAVDDADVDVVAAALQEAMATYRRT